MLFTYKYISHDIEKLQEYLDFLFEEVWILAEGSFDFNKLDGNKELKDLCEKLELEGTGWGEFFNNRIAWIHDEFAKINDDNFKNDLKEWYTNNNNTEILCNDKSKTPINYKTLKVLYPDLEKAINSLYTRLYGSTSPFNLDAFGQLSKKLITSHYKEFMEENKEGLCPFCGISKVDGNIVDTREAYDHYLPKSLYPFNSVNFKNLAPMCDKCNSRNKGTEDPINFAEDRKLAFYPFAINHPKINISVDLKTKDIKNIKEEEIDIIIESPGYEEQIESWKRVFGVEKRYKELCCDQNEGISWFASVVDGFENAKLMGVTDFDKWVEFKINDAGMNELSSYGFIKKQFLEECKKKGLLNAHVS